MEQFQSYHTDSKVKLSPEQKADLTSILDGPGPITVFAPTTSAFDHMTNGHLQYLSSDEVRTNQKLLLHPFLFNVKPRTDPKVEL